MKLQVLLLTFTALIQESISRVPHHSLMHRSLQHSLLQERSLALSSGLPPDLNSTEALCLLLALPTIARTFSEECGDALQQFEAQLGSSVIGSDDEKSVSEDMCTADCVGRLIQFLKEECQNFAVAGNLVGLCAESGGVPCHYITHHYNWTALETDCVVADIAAEQHHCSDKCIKSASSAMDTLGCCANYDHQLREWTAGCGLSFPEHCPDPFKEEEDKEKEEDSDKTGSVGLVDKPDDLRVSGVEASNAVTLIPIKVLFSSVILFAFYIAFTL